MFLHAEYLNEGKSIHSSKNLDKDLICEGKNPKLLEASRQLFNPGTLKKKDAMVNLNWQKLRKGH